MDGPDGLPLRVLVVDDNDDVLTSTVALIERACGCDVRGCNNAASCVAIAEVWQPHLLLLDIAMPEASGIDIAAFLRAENLTPPLLVAMSGYGSEQVRHETAAAGFDYHELKPVPVARLRELVAEARRRSNPSDPHAQRSPTP